MPTTILLEFHDLVIDVGYRHPIMIELSSLVSKYFFNSHNVSIAAKSSFTLLVFTILIQLNGILMEIQIA